MKKHPLLIIITGFPATGKTTLAKEISQRFSLPLACADEFKEKMFDRIGNWEDKKNFDLVSKASYDLMYHSVGLLLSAGQSCIIEAFLLAQMAEPRVKELKEKYDPEILQIQVNCDPQKIIERYEKRCGTDERHPCHPNNIPRDDFFRLEGKSQPVKIEGETIFIDTTDFGKVDKEAVFDKIEKCIK